MRIENIRTICGPNVYHRKSVLVMTLDLQELTETASTDIEGFIAALLKALPGLQEHRCSPGYRGGFVERLHRGTYFAHIVEHIALELTTLIPEIEVGYGKSVYAGREGLYNIVVRYKSEDGMKMVLKSAVELAESLAKGLHDYPLDEKLAAIRELVEDQALGPSTNAIVQAAIKRNIPWRRLNSASLIQFGYGKNRRLIQATTTGLTGYVGVDLAQDKDLTKRLFQRAGIRVPDGILVETEAEALAAFAEIGGAVAIKPVDAQQGKGISLNITTPEQIGPAFALAKNFGSSILVEQYLRGKDYRVLIVNGQMVAAAQRIPAHVIGDGQLCLAELIEQENKNPQRGSGHEKPMTQIKIDEALQNYLERKKISLESVPAKNETIYLRDTANLSTGGISIDVTDQVHPDLEFLCVRAAQAVGLDICGVDLIAEDISASLDQELGIVEVNASPGIRMHLYPAQGSSRDVGGAILNYLYPPENSGRIPIISITGTNGKTTITRLSAFMLGQGGKTVGMTTSDGVYIGKRKILSGDTSGPISAQALLNDSNVEVAVLETARGGIIKRGLGFDQCQVGVITNISEDHIGQDGIEDVEDILRIKSVVADAVAPDGYLILNADDEHLVKLAQKQIEERGLDKIILFSLTPNNSFLDQHRSLGGWIFYYSEGWICECKNNFARRIVRAANIPITLMGSAPFQIANAMTAVAICATQNLDLDLIRAGLENFKASENNHGRVNIYEVNRGQVIVDYGHNPAALAAMCGIAKNWPGPTTAVIGLPGDRDDDLIRKSAQIVIDGIDKVILRDDYDLRGRTPGEVATMICRMVSENAPEKKCQVILDEVEAIKHAIDHIRPDELLLVFYDEKEKVEELLKSYSAKAIEQLSPVRNESFLYDEFLKIKERAKGSETPAGFFSGPPRQSGLSEVAAKLS